MKNEIIKSDSKELSFINKKLNLKARAILNDDGSISINAEDTAIGFGFTQNQNKNGKVYTSIRWETINKYCKKFSFPNELGKDDYIPESLFYLLGMKASNNTAKDFQMWLATEVIPSIRKTGSFNLEQLENKIENMINDAVTKAVSKAATKEIDKVEEKCSEFYRPTHFTKYNISKYIKQRLGITKANEEYELVKQRIFIILGAQKWGDIPMEVLKNSMHIVDESIDVIKKDRPYSQVSMFDYRQVPRARM